ncbi:MAG: sulfatase [Gemmatimonadetes bacterium]|nr:sulfatase [Gemmatimonadota bacterium]
MNRTWSRSWPGAHGAGRILSLALLAVGTFAALAEAQGAGQGGTPRPNIVFILADDLGYSDLSAYGHPYNRTPTLEALAQRGMRFTQAYVASPICSPSRAAIMSGKHPARLNLTNYLVGLRTDSLSRLLPAPFAHQMPAREVTLAELLKQQGYSTGIVGKWHLGEADSVAAFNQGFDYDRIIGRNGLDYYNYSIKSRNREIFADSGTTYLTDKLTDYGVEFIEQNRERPFFLYLAYSAPHVFIVPRGDKLRPYMQTYNRFGGKYNPYYAAMLESLDDGVGRILARLRELNIDQNTIVVFTSDNGGLGIDELGPVPTSNEPLRAWKGFVYEGGNRVPLIVSWPGQIPQNVTNDNYITGTDYLPTFMEILGVRTLPALLDGRSFLSTLRDPGAPFDRGAIFWHYPHFSNQTSRPAGAVRLGNFKLVENYETGKLELFDLGSDIFERSDLSGRMPDKTRELHRLLLSWRQEVGANMPIPSPAYRPER